MPSIVNVDLSGAVSAVLTYEFNNLLDDAGNKVVAQVSRNGGISYATLYTHTGADPQDQVDSVTLDITDYASEDTRIRFLVSERVGDKLIYLDNVRITFGVNQGLYKAVWNGTMPASPPNMTIDSGSAISVDVVSAVSGTTMRVLDDSETYPSQLNTTVSSFIKIESLDIYDAQYSGGSIVTTAEGGDTVYIRPSSATRLVRVTSSTSISAQPIPVVAPYRRP